MHIRRWNEAKLNTALAAELAEACEIHPFLSLMLTAQGVETPEQVLAYIMGTEEEIDSYAFPDMEAAVARIHRAVAQGDAGHPADDGIGEGFCAAGKQHKRHSLQVSAFYDTLNL